MTTADDPRDLISVEELRHRLAADAPTAVVDCRFSLADPDAGRRAWEAGHLPGAVHAHLDDDLAGPVEPGVTGRHPLPDPAELATKLGAWGIDADTTVVAYDDAGGAMAARLWWLLRWLGHDRVAVLDGGIDAWTEAGGELVTGAPSPPARDFEPRPRPELLVDVDAVAAGKPGLLVDSRSAARYRGEEEPIDPVAGHIPGALNRPFPDNLRDGHFRPAAELRKELEELLGGRPARDTAFYCGSGVTAAHNLLALRVAGLGDGRLYNGSWSEWITDPRRRVARGAEPAGGTASDD